MFKIQRSENNTKRAMKMLGWILLLKIRDAGVCSVRGSFAGCVPHEGESGPEGLSSLLCFLLVQRKCRAHLLSAELLLHYQLFLPVTGLCCSAWLFRCGLGVLPHLPIAATLVQFFFLNCCLNVVSCQPLLPPLSPFVSLF